MKKFLIITITILSSTVFGQVEQEQNVTDFLPEGFVIFEKINGDLNKDGTNDCVLIIKGTDKNQIITDEYRGKLDRNRRGIIVLLNKNSHFESIVNNYDCFSSENEDGGVYFAPILSVEIKKGNLYLRYSHGRYGGWEYTFRLRNTDLELIGYDAAYRSNFMSDWPTFDEESINFLSKKKLLKEVIKVDAKGKKTLKETWKNISVNELIKLSEIQDFDELDLTVF